MSNFLSYKKNLTTFITLGVLFGIFIVYVFFSHLIHCYLISYSSFKSYPYKSYISPKMPESLTPHILAIVEEARTRNKAFWGSLESEPTFIFCADDSEFAYFGRDYGTPAMVHLTLQGVYIIIKPDGVNPDVISHELCHAEFFERIGWYAKIHKVPAWFDEGLALHLDYRYPGTEGNHYEDYQQKWLFYTRQGQDSIPLEHLKKINGFFRSNHDNFYTNIAYLTSGKEVARWFDKVGKKGLEQLIQRLKAGKEFDEVYKEIELQVKN